MAQFTFAKENSDFILEKIFSCGIALALACKLTAIQMSAVFIIMGQAHFTLTYIYQIKAGLATPRNVVLFVLCMTALYTTSFYYPPFFTLFAASSLVIHTYVAEVKLQRRRMNIGYLALMAGVMVVNSTVSINQLFGLHLPVDTVCYVILLIGFSAGFGYFIRAKRPISIQAYTIFAIGLLLTYIALALTDRFPYPYTSLGFIGVSHYLTFYAVTARKLYRNNRKRLLVFIGEAAVLNLLIAAGYFSLVWGWWRNDDLYTLWYLPTAFYAWTVMHFISTFKASDYAGSLSFKPSKASF